jgi:hypothetical protein
MLEVHRSRPQLINQLLFLAFLAAAFGLGVNQGMPAQAPENASAKHNGNGWECRQGYREEGHACVAETSEDELTPGARSEVASGSPAGANGVLQENARLRLQIEALSLRNSVLQSDAEDDY